MPLRPERASLSLRRILIFFTVFLGSVQVAAIALSLTSVRMVRPVAMLVLGVSTALAFLTGQMPDVAPPAGGRKYVSSLCPTALRRLILVLTFTIVAVISVAAYFSEDLSYDGNLYHIPPINQWAVRGFIHDVDPAFGNSHLLNGYPKGAEAVTFVFVQAFGSEVLNLLSLFYAPLGFFGIALLCHLFGATASDSLVLGAVYLLVPANVIQYNSTYVDSALGASTIALLALLADNLVHRREVGFAEALPFGCAIGNVIAVKGSGPLIAGVIVLAFLGLLGWSRRSPAVRSGIVRQAVCTGVALLIATSVGGFWYLKNLVRYGSPLYPLGVSIAGHTVFPGESAGNVLFYAQNTPRELHAMNPALRILASWTSPLRTRPWSYPWADTPVSEADTRLGSLGVVWILGCVPAILACGYLLKRGAMDARRRAVYYFLATSVPLAFLGLPMNWWGRYTVWVFGLGLPSVWLVLDAVRDSRPALRHFVRSVAAVCACALVLRASILMLVACLRPFATIERTWHRIPVIVFRATKPLLPLFPEMRTPLLARILATQEAIGVGPQELGPYAELIYGQLSVPIGRHNVVPVPATMTGAGLRSLQSGTHLRYILWLSACPIPSEVAGQVRVCGSEGRFTYMELRPQSSP